MPTCSGEVPSRRYMVEWLLHNSLGQMWLAMCKKHGWTAEVEADGNLARLEARRKEWREKRERGEVALETELKQELRQHGIVIWLDKDGYYNTYVDQLITRYKRDDFFAPVVAFRGSYLEMGEKAERVFGRAQVQQIHKKLAKR